MRYIRLIAVEDDYDNNPGLVVLGTQMTDGIFADRTGSLLPHDILEHINPSLIGQVWDEMQAEGAYWFIRGQHSGNYAGAATDLCFMATDAVCRGEYHWQHPMTREHDYDDCFYDIIRQAREQLSGENAEIDPSFFTAALHNMRYGFNRARRRGHTQRQFDAIENVINRASVDYVGQQFILGFGDGRATLREFHYD